MRKFIGLILTALLLLVVTACSTELNVDQTAFACDSDDDCAPGFSCLPLADGRDACQIPDSIGDLDVGDDANDGDLDAGEDAGDDADAGEDAGDDAGDDTGTPPSCEPDTQEVCPCQGLPLEVDGFRVCGEDEQWGQCTCPEVCQELATGPVVAGSTCGLCDAGTYSCENGQATCSVPAAANACGGCEPHPAPTACSGGQQLKCEPDQSTSCSFFVDSTLFLESMGSRQDLEIFYAFFPYEDETQACQNWEAAVAAEPPTAYRLATGHDAAEGSYTVQLPSTIEDAGVMRIIVRQLIGVSGGTAQMASTHFGCTSVTTPGQDITIDPYLHPHLMRGNYRVLFDPAPSVIGTPADDFWGIFTEESAYPMMYTFASSPGSVFTGCSGLDCPHGEVRSLLAQYDHLRPLRDDVSNLSFWNDFYSTYDDFLDDLTSPDQLAQAYDVLFDEHLELFEAADSNRYARSRFNFTDGVFQPLTQHYPLGYVSLTYPPATPGQESLGSYVAVAASYYDEPYETPCIAVVGIPQCQSVPGVVYSDDVPSANYQPYFQIQPNAGGSSDIGNIYVQFVNIYFPVNATLKNIFYHFLPRELFPRIDETLDENSQVQYSLRDWDSFSQLYRTVAPCDAVVDALIELGEPTAVAESFLPICEELYGDPEGLSVLQHMTEVVPLTIPLTRVNFGLNTPGDCDTVFELDPYHGLRLRSFGPGTGCDVPAPTGGVTRPGTTPSAFHLFDLRIRGRTGHPLGNILN